MSEFVHLDGLRENPACSDATRKAAEDWLETFQLDCQRQCVAMTYPYVSLDTLGCALFTWTKAQPPYRKLEIRIGGHLVLYRRSWDVVSVEGPDKGQVRHFVGDGAVNMEMWRLLWSWFMTGL